MSGGRRGLLPPLDFAQNSQVTECQESPRRRSGSRSGSRGGDEMKPLPAQVSFDLKNVLKMSEIKTDVGQARAFVRLSLERKLLHRHLKELLSNRDLLESLYKDHAFLRCEDEREQFLYHVLSLNAVDFTCFTSTFTKTKMMYRVRLVVGGGRFVPSSGDSTIWMRIGGNLGETAKISAPKGCLEFVIEVGDDLLVRAFSSSRTERASWQLRSGLGSLLQHKNLGILSTVRIGHGNAEAVNKWYLDKVMVRNEVTGHVYRFPCARWFGRGVDDGSLERLLVAEMLGSLEIEDHSDSGSLMGGLMGIAEPKSGSRSNSLVRGDSSSRLQGQVIMEIQQALGEAVNNIVKFMHRPDRDRSQLTQLLCGERGLVWCMEQIFTAGLKTSRLRLRQLFPWDFVERAAACFAEVLKESPDLRRKEAGILMEYCYRCVARIAGNTGLGKEGRFQAFILVTLKDGMLPGLLPLMARCPITQQLYEEASILRSPQPLGFAQKLLKSLMEFQLELEPSLVSGLE